MDGEILAKAIKLRHELHKHPELSMEEHETKRRLMDFVSSETSLEVVDKGSWFYAYYAGKSADRYTGAIAFRADMDALPLSDDKELQYCSVNEGIAHRCGHDGHSAVLAAFACELERRGADRDVYLIFQHGEETGQGAGECAAIITEKDIKEIYAFHNWSGFPEGCILTAAGTVMCASEGMAVKMTGKPAHASQPEDGISPVKAIAELALEVGRITEATDLYKSDVMATIVGMNCGGANYGISPDRGELNLTIRALREVDMRAFRKQLEKKAYAISRKYGLETEISESDVFPETANDITTFEKVIESAEMAGLQTMILEKPFRSSEDFGCYQKKCSGTMFFIGNGEEYPQVHAEKYDFNDRIINTAVEMFCALAGCKTQL